jgi:hypothetical protein
MKSVNMKAVIVMSLAMLGTSAMADMAVKKEATRIDFNKMIDENNSQRADLQKDIANKDAQKTDAQETESDKKKVYDFVDMEVSAGKARPVVDRRFNSVGQPRVVEISRGEMSVQLISKK